MFKLFIVIYQCRLDEFIYRQEFRVKKIYMIIVKILLKFSYLLIYIMILKNIKIMVKNIVKMNGYILKMILIIQVYLLCMKDLEEVIKRYHETKLIIDLHIYKIVLFEISKMIIENKYYTKLFNEMLDNYNKLNN